MNCQKHLFSLKPNIHYLNCAYKAPLLKSSENACVKALIRERNPMDLMVDDFFDEVIDVRKSFGKIVNCNPSNVALIPSTSYGFSSVLNNVKAKSNGNAITVKDEFPSGYYSLHQWCNSNKNNLLIIEPDLTLEKIGANWNEKILSAIDDTTSVVLISSVHWMTGLKFDLKAIGDKCRQVDAIFIVDGTQSVGASHIDVREYHIDALICCSYKWLFGPYSLALAYINDKFEQGTPLEESWMNRTNSKNFSNLTNYTHNYLPNAGKFNVGETSNLLLMPLLKESLTQVNHWGVNEIQSYCQNLIQPLTLYLDDLGVEMEDEDYFSNHLFSLKLPPNFDLTELTKNLKRNNVIISLRGESLRVSVNVFNDQEDIKRLIETIDSTEKRNTFKK